MCIRDSIDTVEYVTELWFLGELVVDQFCLESLLRGYDEESFGTTGADTAEEIVNLGSLS